MLIRFVVKNYLSFKEQTEFNLLPGNRTPRLSHHKVVVNDVTVLRLSAIYGANGSGKSNLIKGILLMKDMVEEGVVPKRIDQSKFKLSPGCAVEPIELGIEFQNGDSNFYYTISVENNQVIYESL